MLGLATNHPSWLVQPLLLVLALGLVIALILGLLLLLRPGAAFALNGALSRWVSTDEHFARLEQPRSWERFFYRHHRVLGALISAGALYVLLRWAFDYNRGGLFSILDRRWLTNSLDWILVAAEWILVGLHVLLLGIGLVILFRPSELKSLERVANRWLHAPSTRKLDEVSGVLDQQVGVYPRVAGLVLTIAAAWCLVRLYPALLMAFTR